MRHRPTLALLGANALGRAGTAALTTYLGAFYAARHGFTAQQLGGVYLALGLGMLAGTAAFGGRLGRLPLLPALLAARVGAGALVAAALCPTAVQHALVMDCQPRLGARPRTPGASQVPRPLSRYAPSPTTPESQSGAHACDFPDHAGFTVSERLAALVFAFRG